MTAALLALAMLEQPECHVRGRALRQLATACRAAEVAHQLPAGILCSIGCVETGGRWKLARWRGKDRRGCDVGIFQLHVSGCESAVVGIMRLAPLPTCAGEAARLLKSRWMPRHRYPWYRWNPGSKRWRVRVASIWGRIRTVAKKATVGRSVRGSLAGQRGPGAAAPPRAEHRAENPGSGDLATLPPARFGRL